MRLVHKYRLAVPGPTPLPPEVVAAAVLPIEDERTERYANVFLQVVQDLQKMLLTQNSVLLSTSSMTGAFEGAIQNLFSVGDRILVVVNGAFGERWVDMATRYGLDVSVVATPWGEPADMHRVAEVVRQERDLTAAIIVHCETSTGVVNDLEAFGKASRSILSIVDSAAGAGACEIRTDDYGLDVVVGGSQKALMTPPGLAFTSVSDRAWAQHETATLSRYYFDWTAARDALAASVPRTPWTPAISLISQLSIALKRLHAEGMEDVVLRHVGLGRIARAGIVGMGLDLLTAPDDRNAAVTAAVLPDWLNSARLVEHLLDRYEIQLAGGQGPLAERIVRIGHCGYVDAFDVITAISALELGLRDLGHPVNVGAGSGAALRCLAEQSGPGLTDPNKLLLRAGSNS